MYAKKQETEAQPAEVENTMEEGSGVVIFDDQPMTDDQPISRPRLRTKIGSAGGTAPANPPAGGTAVETPASGTAAASSSAGGTAMEGISQEKVATKRPAEAAGDDQRRELGKIQPKGKKREADTPVSGIDPDAQAAVPEAEPLCGLPTIHECPVAGYPEWGAFCHGAAAYDERTGVELPVEKVKRARGRES